MKFIFINVLYIKIGDFKMTNIKNFVSKKFNETRAQVMDEYSQRLVEATLAKYR